MGEIAKGLDVYYEKEKYDIFFEDGSCKKYPIGGMLFELISDEAFYLMTTKLENMIRCFPDADLPLTKDNLIKGFQWLYGTVEDEDVPLATELFRSSFNLKIHETLNTEHQFVSVGYFFEACYKEYIQDMQKFAICVDAIATEESKLADEFNHLIFVKFKKVADDAYKVYSKKCSRRHKNGEVIVETHNMQTCMDVLILEYCRFIKEKKVLKKCRNCGRYFVPKNHRDAVYCFAEAPNGPGKSCAKVAPQKKRSKARRVDALEQKHNREYSKIAMAAFRARKAGEDDSYYQKLIEKEMNRYYESKNRMGRI